MGGQTLYVSDLDFTLLRSDATVSAETIRGLNELSDRGVLLTFATARSFRSASRVTHGVRWRHPVVTYGGTIIVDGVTGQASDVALLDDAVVQAVCAATATSQLEPVFHTYEDGSERIRWRPENASPGSLAFVEKRTGDPRLLPLDDWSRISSGSAYYAIIIGEEGEVRALAAELERATRDCAVFIAIDGYTRTCWLEIHAGDATKAHAARRVADRLGADRIVAFGDNHNDVPLFRIADESYAVGNAVPELRAQATAVLDGDNDSDAVVRWLLANA